MKKISSYACVLAAVVGLAACKKEAISSLPAASQVGANTGGCLLNGQTFVATGWPGSHDLLSSVKPTPAISGGFLNDSTVCVQLVGYYENRRSSLTIFVRYHGLGEYRFDQDTPRFGCAPDKALLNHAYLYQDYGAGQGVADIKEYRTDALHTGSLTLTYTDRKRGIVAGQFEFSAQDKQGSSALLDVKQGRFDCGE